MAFNTDSNRAFLNEQELKFKDYKEVGENDS